MSRTLVELWYKDHVLADRRQLADEINVSLREVCKDVDWMHEVQAGVQ
jgi:hypothetical protein